jgi:hypothetical protein
MRSRSALMKSSDALQPDVTVLPGMKQVLFIEVGFGADQHGQVYKNFCGKYETIELRALCMSAGYHKSGRESLSQCNRIQFDPFDYCDYSRGLLRYGITGYPCCSPWNVV